MLNPNPHLEISLNVGDPADPYRFGPHTQMVMRFIDLVKQLSATERDELRYGDVRWPLMMQATRKTERGRASGEWIRLVCANNFMGQPWDDVPARALPGLIYHNLTDASEFCNFFAPFSSSRIGAAVDSLVADCLIERWRVGR